ncbi:MAG: hypothetical protein ACQEVA_13350 [Myxococcota bacterium]
MRHLRGWRLAMGLLIAATLGFGAGCAEDVGDIDRTQPDKIQKSLFQDNDEWYYRQTVIDTDTQGSVIFEALESPLKRVRWEITDNVLYAFSTVPIADGLQDGLTDPDTRQLGAVAAFPIVDHFDVQRSYNSSTGEQSNVLVEDRSDKPWYEREYMRVDWSTNLVDGNGMFENALGVWSSSRWDPPQDSGSVHPDRARIGEDYIDVTTQYIFQPDVYACVYNVAIDTQFSCEGGKVQTRSSFIRIDDEQKKTYEPFLMRDREVLNTGGESGDVLQTASIYDQDSGFYFDAECNDQTKQYLQDEYGDTDERCSEATFDMFSRFGYFRTQRVKYDKQRGVVDQNRMYYANRWNIWQSAYDDEGNRLDISERKPQPVVYHLNAEYPRDMIPAAEVVEAQWDDAFKESVMIAKGYDSMSQVETELEELYGDKRMFKIERNSCHPQPLMQWRDQHGSMKDGDRKNPMTIFDDFISEYGSAQTADALENTLWGMPKQERIQLCAELEFATAQREDADARFSWERVGDLRYSFFNWVDEFNGYWSGYGPSAADPLTGQIISGNANFAGTPLRRYSTYGADIVQYVNGELDENDIRRGDHIRDYVQNMQQEQAQQSLEPSLPVDARQELANRRGISVEENSPTGFTERPDFAEQDDFIKKWGKDRIQREANRLSETITEAKRSDTRKLEFYDQPSVKRFMMADADFQQMVKGLATELYGQDASDDQLHQAYLDVAAPRYAYDRQQRRLNRFAKQNIFASENLERSMSSLVTYEGVAEAFKGEPREKIRRYIMENAFIGTQLHEVGHTVGLRHNFSASMDALNYHDGYWNIQRAILEGNLSESERNAITDAGMIQDLTGKDLSYLSEAETRLASIMDYTGDLTGRFSGLGKYDKAAINFAYAEHVEQWKKDIDLPNLLWYEEWTRDYSELPQIYANDPSNTDASVRLEGIDIIQDGREWVPIQQAMTEKREGIRSNTSNWHNQQLTRNNQPYIDRTVPYEFCSDEFRDSRLGCDVFDWGGNQTEVVNHAFNSYRFFQPFWRYRDQDTDWQMFYNSYISRVMRTLGVASRPFRYYSIYQWWDLGSYTADLERASVDALNFYSEMLAMPEPGRYCRFNEQNADITLGWHYDLENTFVPSDFMTDGAQCDNHIDINRGKGQYYGYDFTDEYYYRINRVGTYIDKSLAAQALFDISANYAFSSFFTDFRATNISFWTLFEDEMHTLLRGLVIGDYHGFGGVYNPRKQDYDEPQIVDLETLGTGEANGQENMTRIYTPVSINQEFSTLVGGMLNASTWYDRSSDFSQYVKVSVTNDELQPYPNGTEVATFTHPVTNQIYHAPQTGDGRSVTVDLVEWANDLKDDWEVEQADLEQLQPGTDDYVRQREEVEGTRRQMEDVIAKLDMIRFLYQAMGPDALR